MTDTTRPLGEQQYVELTTFRRNGTPVSTPVWIAPDGDDLLIVTVDETGKTKRLAHTARVELRPCDVRGNVPPNAPRYAARARVDRGPDAVARVKRAIGAKYGWWYRALTLVEPVLDRLPGRKVRAAVVVTDVRLLGS
ncbi:MULTISPECIES: PPOX class F420-dependent oxidoreductase [unclassified Knoellia]|uniref:PPOX class F420-dependent oxidoreductase n=1 Tax=Knoellia altitudinis TaxID=3404795 RepID=UPI003611D5C9